MSNLFWLIEAQMNRLRPFFPRSHGRPRVDDRRVLSGIISINRNGLRWFDAPREYGPAQTLYNRWKRWSRIRVFARIMEGLASEAAERKTIMIDATYLKAHRTASSLRVKKGGRGRSIGRTKGGLNTKLHAITDAKGRPLKFFMIAGAVSDYTGAAALLDHMPKAEWLLADRGYDADWYREALKDKGIRVCIPVRKKPQDEDPLRPLSLQTTQPHRDHVWKTHGLAPRRNPIGPLPNRLPLRRRPRSHRSVLVVNVNVSGA